MLSCLLIFSLLLVGSSWAAPMEYENSFEESDVDADISIEPDEPDIRESAESAGDYKGYIESTSETPKPISSAPTTLTPPASFSTSTAPTTVTTSAAPTTTPITTSAQTTTSVPTTTLDPISPSPVTFARPVDNPMAPLRPIFFTTTVQVDQQITLKVKPLAIYKPINQFTQVRSINFTSSSIY